MKITPEIKAKSEYSITVEDKICWLKKIDRATLEVALGLIMATTGQPQYIRAGEIILLNCWVNGDEEIKKDDKYLIPACLQAYELIQLKEASLKKI